MEKTNLFNKEKLNVINELFHEEKLVQIRKKCLNGTHPLRFIDYAIEEASYLNEYNFWKNR